MTVIACKDGIMVADRKHEVVDGKKSYSYGKCKIENYKNMFISFSGNIAAGELMSQWFKEGAFAPDCPNKFPKRFSDPKYNIIGTKLIVVVKILGVFRYTWGDPKPCFIGGQFCAFGSGGTFALGAMEHGATAEEAVRIACEFDDGCGMGINKRKFW